MLRRTDLRRELRRLILAVGFPLIGFMSAMVALGALHERREVENELKTRTQAAAARLVQELDVWRSSLQVLGGSHALRVGRLEDFYREAQLVAAQQGASVLLFDRDGIPLLSTARALGVKSAADAELAALAWREGHAVLREGRLAAVSGVMPDPESGSPVIWVTIPVPADAYEVTHLLVLALGATRVRRVLDEVGVHAGWMVAVGDGQRKVVARGHQHERYVTSSVLPRWFGPSANGPERGTAEGIALDGMWVRTAYEKIPGTEWVVAVGARGAELQALWLKPILFLVAAAAAFACLAWLLSRHYARRLRNEIILLLPSERRDHGSKQKRTCAIKEIETVRLLLERQARFAMLRAAEHEKRIAAEEANRMKDLFLATVSHELRTPLAAILGWTNVMHRRKTDSAFLDRAIAVIERNARQQAIIIEDLLDMSRILAGKLEIQRAPTDLAATVSEALDACRPAAEAKRIAVRFNLERNVWVEGDHSRLMQVITNLVSNGVKFTQNGGEVVVSLKRAEGRAILAVADNGGGIPAELLPHVFERYRQAQTGSSPRHSGLGLGLAIVRHLVEAHGGRVSAQSDGAGQGARFTVELPAAMASGSPHPADAPGCHRDALQGLEILVVDAHSDTREWVSGLLSRHGAITAQASSSAEALERLNGSLPQLLVSDIVMPGGDGHRLVRQMKSMAASRKKRVRAIALTACAGNEHRERALDAGFDCYIAKGSDPEHIVREAARLVSARLHEGQRYSR